MNSEYTPTPTGVEIEENDLDLQDMTIGDEQGRTIFEMREEQYQLVPQPWWKRTFRSAQTRKMGIILLLLFLVGASIIGYIGYHTPRTNNTLVAENQDANSSFAIETEKEEKVAKQLLSMQTDDNDDEEQSERLPQLRSYSRYEKSNKPEIVGHMHLYFRQSIHGSSRRSLQRLSVPVARYNSRRFPLKGPFISLMPWIPIFSDRHSKQTIIYSKGNGVYILPSLINKYDKIFSIAELITSGYASLSSNGLKPGGIINMKSLFRSKSLMGSRIPRINPLTGGFTDGIHTNYGYFSIPKHPEIVFDIDHIRESEGEEEKEEDNNRYPSDRYDSDERPPPPPPPPRRGPPPQYPKSCSVRNGGCDPNSTCSHDGTTNAVVCICNTGYTNTGGTRVVVCTDSCTVNSGGCDPNSACSHHSITNAVVCTCNTGYTTIGGTGAVVCTAIATTCSNPVPSTYDRSTSCGLTCRYNGDTTAAGRCIGNTYCFGVALGYGVSSVSSTTRGDDGLNCVDSDCPTGYTCVFDTLGAADGANDPPGGAPTSLTLADGPRFNCVATCPNSG